MARCEDCLHYKLCVDTETRHLKIILAGDRAERCNQFMPTAEVARGIFEEIEEAIEKCKYNQSTPFGIEERYNPYAIIKQVAKLKKKYTEESNDVGQHQ